MPAKGSYQASFREAVGTLDERLVVGDVTLVPDHTPWSPAPQPPAVICRAGQAAAHAWKDFFDARMGNSATRRAYRTAVRQFLAWATSALTNASTSSGSCRVTAIPRLLLVTFSVSRDSMPADDRFRVPDSRLEPGPARQSPVTARAWHRGGRTVGLHAKVVNVKF